MCKTSRYTFPMKKCFCVVCVVLMLLSASWLRAQEPIDFVNPLIGQFVRTG